MFPLRDQLMIYCRRRKYEQAEYTGNVEEVLHMRTLDRREKDRYVLQER